MQIHLNGEPRQLPESMTVADLLEDMQLAQRRLAIELNGEILPRSEYHQYILNPEDHLEIVHAIGGG